MVKYRINNISQIETMLWCMTKGHKVPYMTSRIEKKLYSYIKSYNHYRKHDKMFYRDLELSSKEYYIIIDKMIECRNDYHNTYLHLKRTLDYIKQD